MFRFMRDTEPQDPAMFMMDPFALHRHHMRSMFSGNFGMSPFLGITDGSVASLPRAASHRNVQPGAVTPFGMMGMGGGGFMDMFGMMNDLMSGIDQMSSGSNCQTYSSSTVISYSNMGGSGTPKVYQETSQTRTAPGGIRETRRTMRDSDSGVEQMSIGHHIRDRAHIMQRCHNRRTGDREERQEFINMDENDAAGFDEEWQRETYRYRGQRGVAYRRRGEPEERLAIQAPEDNTARPSRRYDW
ncbi:myeloid leukemia factor 2 [Spea bombifrons]|uniref:myeloid leukemia factor 2 n=1 Tax=Spea bombifrons TaxID=233779 RepID=UPI00234940D3|nr:myeloid leukemia factor 2 [Spea bombifrons]XP_053306210.1 myeloid leukemia factor 2 [Spea bombifrons]XP_053306211.1 myeloid leukemia factor 2 [Spea bombifrons]XP_053306212.1 myeloid leukemia factor 2 [Spea bombifrons]XP_053306213.1 myeloid leukemia factor 2 [Spea bombifrons]XP_053306214.1 myeloid leukemia factor 2 [Spea bombifrons]